MGQKIDIQSLSFIDKLKWAQEFINDCIVDIEFEGDKNIVNKLTTIEKKLEDIISYYGAD